MIQQTSNIALALRSTLGGVLMGLANLVPGISGGTMLLAAGVYPRFIEGIADITRLRLRRESLVVLTCVVFAALAAIVLLAGPVKDLVVQQRWIMYSLFIGLTLGGVPVVWRLIGRATPAVVIGAVVGFAGMAALALAQAQGAEAADRTGWIALFLAGIAGASAMILPGVSGGYLLLVLGVYVPLLAAIGRFRDAARAMDVAGAFEIGLTVLLPVGLGVIVGVVGVSNLLKLLLARYEKATLGVLLGLLLGAVVGLFPFQAGVAPEPGTMLKNQTVATMPGGGLMYAETGRPVEPDDWPTAFFTPSAGQVVGSLALIAAGFAVTLLVDRVGRDKPEPSAALRG